MSSMTPAYIRSSGAASFSGMHLRNLSRQLRNLETDTAWVVLGAPNMLPEVSWWLPDWKPNTLASGAQFTNVRLHTR
jgi:hypothetical protein